MRNTEDSVFPGFMESEVSFGTHRPCSESPCTCLFLQVIIFVGMEEAMDCLGSVVPDAETEKHNRVLVLFCFQCCLRERTLSERIKYSLVCDEAI